MATQVFLIERDYEVHFTFNRELRVTLVQFLIEKRDFYTLNVTMLCFNLCLFQFIRLQKVGVLETIPKHKADMSSVLVALCSTSM